jgi:hypothetical protein
MKRNVIVMCVIVISCNLFLSFNVVAQEEDRGKPLIYNEDSLKNVYSDFIDSLNPLIIIEDYPKSIKNLLSSSVERQKLGLETLGSTTQIEILPWIIPFLNSKDDYVRIYAIRAINKLVEHYTLKRRDWNISNQVRILPLKSDNVDLRPLAWLVLQNIRQQEPNIASYAARVAGYLNLNIFREEILLLKQSIHPAVVDSANTTLEMWDNWFEY